MNYTQQEINAGVEKSLRNRKRRILITGWMAALSAIIIAAAFTFAREDFFHLFGK